MALVDRVVGAVRRTRAPRGSRVNQATCMPASTAACPSASSRNVLPVPGRPADARGSRAGRPIPGCAARAWVGGGTDDSRLVPGVEGLPGGERGPGAAGGQRGPVPAGDFLGQQRAEHLGGVPPLGLGGGEHLRGGAAHVRQPHPAQQPFQALVQRRRGRCRGGHRALPAAGGEVEVVDREADLSGIQRCRRCGSRPAASVMSVRGPGGDQAAGVGSGPGQRERAG